MPHRKIIHVDMDSFFVAVEERDNPCLKGKPVAVGGQAHARGVISTANYIARKFGVHSAMASQKALSLCPNLIVISGNFEKYREASNDIRNIFQQYTELVEPISLDEAFLDVTAKDHCEGSATLMAQEIRQKIFATTQLTASAGISCNKFVAKVASDWNKPNGQFLVKPDQVDAFVAKLPVNKIFGVGPRTAEKLNIVGIKTCQDLRQYSEKQLHELFGKFGIRLYGLCRGIDERAVNPNRIRKSLSVEETFTHDLVNFQAIATEIEALLNKLLTRLNKLSDRSFNKIFVKLKFSDFNRTTVETCGSILHLETLTELFQTGFLRGDGKSVRLLGLGVRFTLKTEVQQLELFQ